MPQKHKTLLACLAAPVLLYGLLVVGVPFLLDTGSIQTRISQSTKQALMLEMEFSGEPATTAFPSPSITYQNVLVKDASGTQVMEIPALHVHLGWLGLFSPNSASLHVENPSITLSAEQWQQWTSRFLSESRSTQGTIRISGARLSIATNADITGDEQKNTDANSYLAEPWIASNLSANLTPQDFSAAFDWRGKTISLQGQHHAQQKTLSASLSIDTLLHAELEGTLQQADSLDWKGTASLNVTDMVEFTQWFQHESSATPAPPSTNDTAPRATFPLRVKGEMRIAGHSLLLHRSPAEFNSAPAEFAAFIGWRDSLQVALELNPDALPVDSFLAPLGRDLMQSNSNHAATPALVKPLVPEYLNIILLLKTKQATLAGKPYHALQLNAELGAQRIDIHQMDLHMPGESELQLSGSIRELPEGRRFYGIAAIEGKHFNEWLGHFEPLATKLPADDFSNFAAKGNVFISKEQLRFSEADLQIGQLAFQGGFATFFDQVPRVEAEIRLQDINLDYFRDIWAESKAGNKGLLNLVNERSTFEWLRTLPAVLDFYITMDNFTFLGSPGKIATTRLYSKPGEIMLSSIDMRLADNTINGNINFNVMDEIPKLDIVLSASQFDTSYFSLPGEAPSPPFYDLSATPRLSQELFDVSLLSAMNAGLDITLRSLTHNGTLYENFKWLAALENQTLNIKKLSFSMLGGVFDFAGALTGGSVPGLSANFTLYNADLNEILKAVYGFDHISGRISVSGVVGTSGINPQAWVEQGEMNITAAARGVRVQRFDLQNAISVTKEARSTQDVKNGVESQLFTGLTELSVDGNINMKNGIMRTPGIRLAYGNALGSLAGEMNMLDWRMNLSNAWQFPEISSSTIPTMNISFQGGIDNYTTRIDTSSLEAFVAKRIVGQ